MSLSAGCETQALGHVDSAHNSTELVQAVRLGPKVCIKCSGAAPGQMNQPRNCAATRAFVRREGIEPPTR